MGLGLGSWIVIVHFIGSGLISLVGYSVLLLKTLYQ